MKKHFWRLFVSVVFSGALVFPTRLDAANSLPNKCASPLERVAANTEKKEPESKSPEEKAKGFFSFFPKLKQQTSDLVDIGMRAVTGKLSRRDTRLRKILLSIGGLLHRTGYLPTLIRFAGRTAFKLGQLPTAVTKESLERNLDLLIGIVEGELMARGYTRETTGVEYEQWSTFGRRTNREAQEVVGSFRNEGKSTLLFEDPAFLKEFQKQTGTEIKNGSSVELLIDGPASFAKRDQMIEKAKDKIYIGSWAWYDDATGDIYAKKLIAKKKNNPKIDIKVVVDGQTATNPEKQKRLQEMEKAGIEILRWYSTNPKRPYDGYHKKLMLVDGNELVLGGLNFGDEYSHLGPPEIKKWRDTDVYVKGVGSRDAENLFVTDWNEQVQNQSKGVKGKKISLAAATTTPIDPVGQYNTALTNHTPGKEPNIYRSMILAIHAANKRIDIENAYILLDPGLYEALLAAKKRGVEIRVLTNSEESVDVPEMSYMMMRSANRMAEAGFKVYVKKGATLHTKALVVDSTYGWVGSHNLHGRSHRYEGEMTFAVFSPEFGQQMVKMIDEDCKPEKATFLEKPIPLKPNTMAEALGYWIFDQL